MDDAVDRFLVNAEETAPQKFLTHSLLFDLPRFPVEQLSPGRQAFAGLSESQWAHARFRALYRFCLGLQTREPGKEMASELTEMVPSEILEILGPPALLPTEDPARYQKMLIRAAADLRPTDIIGWMLVKNLIDQFFDIARYRRMMVAWMRLVANEKCVREGPPPENFNLRKLLIRTSAKRGELSPDQKQELAQVEIDEAEHAAKIQNRINQGQGVLPSEHDLASVLPKWITEYEQLYHLLCVAEKRFSFTRAEIDQHYRGLGRELRESFDQIIDAEVIEPESRSEVQRPRSITNVPDRVPVDISPTKASIRRSRTQSRRESLQTDPRARQTQKVQIRTREGA